MAGVRNVVINAKECFDAFALKSLMAQKGSSAAMLSGEGLAQNVVLDPPAGQDSLLRNVSWYFAFPVVATDESTLEELEGTLQALLNLVGAGVTVAWGTFAGAFAGAGDLIAKTLAAGQTLAALWDDAERPGIIGCRTFDVTFVPPVDNQPPAGFVGYALMLESRWINSARTNPDNHGYTTCEELKVNGVQFRSRGVNSSRPLSTQRATGVYRYPVIAAEAKPITQAVDRVSYQILSQVHAASGSFGNFNTEVQLRVVVADTAAAVNAAIEQLTQVAAADVPPDEDRALVGADLPWRLDVPATLVATNGEARHLLVAARLGRVVHLGSHLGRMSLGKLHRIALGLQVEVGGADKAALARRIAEKVGGRPA